MYLPLESKSPTCASVRYCSKVRIFRDTLSLKLCPVCAEAAYVSKMTEGGSSISEWVNGVPSICGNWKPTGKFRQNPDFAVNSRTVYEKGT